MEFAVIETGGKQYRVQQGDTILIEKIPSEEGSSLSFPAVVAYFDGKDIELGDPFLSGRQVQGEVVSQEKADKIRVFKMQPKKRMQKTQGHRQNYTRVKITSLSASASKKKEKTEESKAE